MFLTLGAAGAMLIGWAAFDAPQDYRALEIVEMISAIAIPCTIAAFGTRAWRLRGDRKVAEYDAMLARIAALHHAD